MRKSADKYKATTKNFQWLIQHAIDNDVRLRAMGSGWSFSKVAVTEGGIIDTKSLRLSFALSNSYVSPKYLDTGKTAKDLFFVQCGMSMLHLNTKLEKRMNPKRALKASGASNGQTIAGATSTGTHGAAFNFGSTQDFIVGFHIITGPNRHVWLERASHPITSDRFTNWLGAEVIRDDAIFNAALISFGSFGFIHGIMIETEPIYLLEEHRIKNVPYNNALKKAMNELDFSELEPSLPHPVKGEEKELYHFEVILNPHDFEPNSSEGGVYVKTIYKFPFDENLERGPKKKEGFTYGDELLGLIQSVLDSLGGFSKLLIPKLVNLLFPVAYSATDEPIIGTVGEIFDNSNLRGKVASAAMGIDIKDTSRVVEEILKLNDKKPFPGALGLRFVKGTQALLGFTKFQQTCVLEMDGVDSDASRAFYQRVWNRLEQLGIPYTLHWGKINFNLTADRIREMYRNEKVEQWLMSRNSLLDEESRKVFTNQFMERGGLDQDIMPVPESLA